MDPYRTLPSRDRPRPARLERTWPHVLTVPVVVATAPVALVGLCEAARAYVGPWFMPATILYAVIGYAAFVLCVCAFDGARRR